MVQIQSPAGNPLLLWSPRRTLPPVRIVKLRIDGQEFYLPGDVDVDMIRAQILDAIKGPGAFVHFQPIGRGEVSVLMTPHVKARIEIQDQPDTRVEEWESEPPDMDVEFGFPSF
jgi:hypothetical protein